MGRSKTNRGQARKEELRADAEVRREHRAGLSNSQQIERLNERLGVGVGAKQERHRLERELEVESAKRTKTKTSGSTRERGKKRSKKERRRGSTTNE